MASTAPNIYTLGIPTMVPGSDGTLYDVPFVVKFQLQDVANYNELINLFDNYRIRNVMVKLSFNGTSTYLAGSPVTEVQYITDTDDDTMPALTSWSQRMGVKSKTFGSKNTVYMGVNPLASSYAVSSLGLSSGVQVPCSTWLDTVHPNLQHFGIKGVFRNCWLPQVVENFIIRAELTYDIELKSII